MIHYSLTQLESNFGSIKSDDGNTECTYIKNGPLK